jgi:hypothetical protein
MSHQLSFYDQVLIIRLNEHTSTQELVQDVRDVLEHQVGNVIAILDTTLATSIDQNLRSLLYRIFQHHAIKKIGVCGINPEIQQEMNDLVVVLQRVRHVTVAPTESDLRSQLGLAPQARKLNGMLAYLKKAG